MGRGGKLRDGGGVLLDKELRECDFKSQWNWWSKSIDTLCMMGN